MFDCIDVCFLFLVHSKNGAYVKFNYDASVQNIIVFFKSLSYVHTRLRVESRFARETRDDRFIEYNTSHADEILKFASHIYLML